MLTNGFIWVTAADINDPAICDRKTLQRAYGFVTLAFCVNNIMPMIKIQTTGSMSVKLVLGRHLSL